MNIRPYSHMGRDKFWLGYADYFRHAVAVLGYDHATARHILWTSMSGPAQAMVRDISPAVVNAANDTLEDLITRFGARFNPPEQGEMAKSLFENVVQRPRESLQEYHSRCHVLFAQAYPHLQHEHDLVIRRFLKGLSNIRLSENVARRSPATFQQALTVTMNEFAVLQLHTPASKLTLEGGAGPFANTQNAPSHNPRYPDPEPMDINQLNQLGDKYSGCYDCGSKEHMSRYCPKKGSRVSGGRGGGRGTSHRAGGNRGNRGGGRGGAARGGPSKQVKTSRRTLNELTEKVIELSTALGGEQEDEGLDAEEEVDDYDEDYGDQIEQDDEDLGQEETAQNFQ